MAYLDQIKKHLPFHNYVTNSSDVKDKYRPVLKDALNGGSFQYVAKKHNMRFPELTRVWRECVNAYIKSLDAADKTQLLAGPLIGADGSVKHLELTSRAQHAVECLGIKTISQLVNTPDLILLRLPNFGRKTLIDLDAALQDVGLVRNGKDPQTFMNFDEPEVEIETIVQTGSDQSNLEQLVQKVCDEQKHIKDLLMLILDAVTTPAVAPPMVNKPRYSSELDELLEPWGKD